MDPNEALKRCRESAKKMLSDDDIDSPRYVAIGAGLAEHFDALDQWLVRGGFLPKDWEKVRTPSKPARKTHSAKVCQDSDPGCPHHKGANCVNKATMTVYRIDMEDWTGIAVCHWCAEDMLNAGTFSTERAR